MALPLSQVTALAGGGGGALRAPPRPVVRTWLPGGDLGIYATLRAMRAQARAIATHPVVTQAARDAIAGASSPWHGLRDYLTRFTRFKQDPPDAETVYTPLDQLARIARDGIAAGDCDDVATLGAALATAARIPARFVVVGFRRPTAPYTHVYTEIATPQGWRDFDLTRTAHSPRPTRRATVGV